MKYLIIRGPHGGEFPVFCCAPQSHRELAAAWQASVHPLPGGRQVVAAGFVEFLPTGAAIVFGRSESLGLGTRPGCDAALISALYLGTVTMGRDADFALSPAVPHRPASARELPSQLRDDITRAITPCARS